MTPNLPAAMDAGTAKRHSVVRVDPQTGRLVRVVESAPGKRNGMRDSSAVKTLVAAAAKTLDVDPLLVQSVIQAESAFDPLAVSHKGAQGLMQLMPATARRFGVTDAFDPKDNIEGGVKYLKYLRGLFPDDRLAIAAYNAGEGAVAKYNGVPPYKETVAYVDRVARKYGEAKKAASPAIPQAGGQPSPDESSYPSLGQYFDEQGRLHMVAR